MRHPKYKFKVGDKVKVLRLWDECEEDSLGLSVHMDNAVDGVYTILSRYKGFSLDNAYELDYEDDWGGTYIFYEFVLESASKNKQLLFPFMDIPYE